MTTTKFFVTGATGYIGGTVLDHFLSHPSAKDWEFTALTRSEDKGEKLKALGVTPVYGNLSDLDVIEKAASEADVVIAMADCDDLAGAEATLRGLKKRFEATGKPPVFINTSGTGVLAVDSLGKEATKEVYDDLNPDQIESLKPTQPHRPVDLAIVQADKDGYVKTYIILPSTIWGLAKTRFVDAGIQNHHSIQIPSLISASLARGQGGMVGEGKNLWPNVEVHELATLYTTLYDAILKGDHSSLGHGREGFYFGENGEHSLYDVGKAVASALVELGRGKSEEPTTFTEEEIKKYFGTAYLGSNSRCRANRSKAIGWKPTKSTKEFLASIKPETDAIIKDGYNPILH